MSRGAWHNTKHDHIKNQHVNMLLEKGWSIADIGKFYGVQRNVIRSRVRTIENQKRKNIWVDEPGATIPEVSKKTATRPDRHKKKRVAIWELPKAYGEITTYMMDMDEVREKYGLPGAKAEKIPAYVWLQKAKQKP